MARPITLMPTRIELIPAAGGVRVGTKSGLLRPQVRWVGGKTAKVTLVATGATLLGGDHIDLEIIVGTGLTLDLSDVAGTVVYDGRGRACYWHTRIVVAEGATLIWHGEPLVVSSGGKLLRRTDVDVAGTGRLLMRDTVALGRSGEDGGELTCRTRMSLAGTPALAEDLVLSAERRSWPGMLGDAKVIDTVTALGWQPDAALGKHAAGGSPASAASLGLGRAVDSGGVSPATVPPAESGIGPTGRGSSVDSSGASADSVPPAHPSSPGAIPFTGARGASRLFELPCPGAMSRALVARAHFSDAPTIWTAWRRSLIDGPDT